VQLSHDKIGIAFIQSPQKLFCKLLQSAAADEAVPSIDLKTPA
jgi:hypothetical protein